MNVRSPHEFEPRRVGAHYLGNNRCRFTVWAPLLRSVSLVIEEPERRVFALEGDEYGYWSATLDGIQPGTRYWYRVNSEREYPDPSSFFQPDGVHSLASVVDHTAFAWSDANWNNIPLNDLIIYELHVGTFTPEGTFDGVLSRLDYLQDLGVNAIELMPVAQYPGDRNWGYDGAYLFAVQNTYGGPDGLKRLVDGCHARGMAVILDVVYNHFGPEGNYIGIYAPFYTSKYKTPWGDSINYDDRYSYGVRQFVVQNALYWLDVFHIDALRLDAVHSIVDMSATHILRELSDQVSRYKELTGRTKYLIAESDLNDVRVIDPPGQDGYGIDAQWSDDFHHAVHALLTRESSGYYRDFGMIGDLIKQLNEGYTYTGQFSWCRMRRYGNSPKDRPGAQFVICIQNHDQIGNRMLGDRLSSLVSPEAHRLAAALLLFSPYLPLLFMGQEYSENAPFLYFTSHFDQDLVRAVREGRREEFGDFAWSGEVPDPQDPATFQSSRLDWALPSQGMHGVIRAFYRECIRLRKTIPSLKNRDRGSWAAEQSGGADIATLHRLSGNDQIFVIAHFSDRKQEVTIRFPGDTAWTRLLSSADEQWNGAGSLFPRVAQREGSYVAAPFELALYHTGEATD